MASKSPKKRPYEEADESIINPFAPINGGDNKRPRLPPSPSPFPASSSEIPSSESTEEEDTTMTENIEPRTITLVVGKSQETLAVHEDVLWKSPILRRTLRNTGGESPDRIIIRDELPEVMMCVIDYLETGDYEPHLAHDRRTGRSYLGPELEEHHEHGACMTQGLVFHPELDDYLLKDTAIYCAANKLGLKGLKQLALRKQGLRTHIRCGTILASARYVYDHTPSTEVALRTHYVDLIVRSRDIFRRSGEMQSHIWEGQSDLLFDIFAALCKL